MKIEFEKREKELEKQFLQSFSDVKGIMLEKLTGLDKKALS